MSLVVSAMQELAGVIHSPNCYDSSSLFSGGMVRQPLYTISSTGKCVLLCFLTSEIVDRLSFRLGLKRVVLKTVGL